MSALIDLNGRVIGRLTVRCLHSKKPAKWLCDCTCGNSTIVGSGSLLQGRTMSCGCLQKERTSSAKKTHGQSTSGDQHRLYVIWRGMKARCLNPNNTSFHDYGARGVSICDEWMDFPLFAQWALQNGYADDLTIDRKDVDGDYKPENCRWVTKEIQAQEGNRHTKAVVSSDGQFFPRISLAAEITGAPRSKICEAARGSRKTAGGYGWRYATQEEIAANSNTWKEGAA